MTEARPLAVTMGEPAGIGPDLILRLFSERAEHGLPPFVVFGNLDFLRARASRLRLDVALEAGIPADAEQSTDRLIVVDPGGLVPDHPGTTTPLSGRAVIAAIEGATAAVLHGECRALVTAPIHKAALYSAGFTHPGHTEFLAYLCAEGGAPRRPLMMLAHGELRVVPATIHVPLVEVPRLVTTQLIVETATILAHDLKTRFGISSPRLAVTGLNPHAGEGGSIGREEVDILVPAIEGLKFDGLSIEGPFPADTLFYPPRWREYDAVIAMYHDQGLIPIKTVAFDAAVNVTLGLPLVRTSPDHGTALDLAGTGKASPSSFLAALRLADTLASQHA